VGGLAAAAGRLLHHHHLPLPLQLLQLVGGSWQRGPPPAVVGALQHAVLRASGGVALVRWRGEQLVWEGRGWKGGRGWKARWAVVGVGVTGHQAAGPPPVRGGAAQGPAQRRQHCPLGPGTRG
jgi:hypothetical protein